MPLVKSKVDVTSHFEVISQAANEHAKRAVTIAATEGGRVAASVAARRSKSGRMAGIRIESAKGTVDGWVASFVSPVHYAWFQNYGTLGNRRKALKEPGRQKRNFTRAPGTGIEPLGFLEAGKRAGRAALLAEISRGL